MTAPLLSLRGVFTDAEGLSPNYSFALDIPTSNKHICVVGASGTGKSRLALAMAGFFEQGFQGEVFLNGISMAKIPHRVRAKNIGWIPSNPLLVFSGIKKDLAGEIELGLEMLGVNAPDEYAKLKKYTGLFRVDNLLSRDPYSLSGGEKVRAALAVTLAKQPELLLLDQIYDALDPESLVEVRNILAQLSNEGLTVVEFHSRAPSWIDEADLCVFLLEDKVLQGGYDAIWRNVGNIDVKMLPPSAEASLVVEKWSGTKLSGAPCRPEHLAAALIPVYPTETLSVDKPSTLSAARASCFSQEPALTVQGLLFSYPDFKLGPVNLSCYPGERVALLGPNGAGKTTLLMSIALLLHPDPVGSITVLDDRSRELKTPPPPKYRHIWARSVIYCFQDPDEQLYLATVKEELMETARRCEAPDPLRSALNIAHELGLDGLLDHSPMDLPRPLRRLVTVGGALAAFPPVLLLDEPSAGLDPHQKQKLNNALLQYTRMGGCAIFISHDYDFVAETANRLVYMQQGKFEKFLNLEEGQSYWPLEYGPTAWEAGAFLPRRAPRTLKWQDLLSAVGLRDK